MTAEVTGVATRHDDAADDVPPTPPDPIRSPRDRRARLAARWGFPLGLALLAVLTLVFSLMGRDAILDSTEGDVVEAVTDPDEPGFRVLVEPTPSSLWLLVDDGELVGVVLAGLADADGGGGLGVLPARLATRGSAGATLAEVFAAEGVTGLRAAVTAALDIGVGELVTIETPSWETLAGPVAPLTVDLPTALTTVDGSVFLPAGEVTIAADQVGAVLAWVSPDEDPGQRVVRQGLVLSALLDAVADAGPDVVPGEGDVGAPRFLRAFAAGTHVVRVPETTVEGDALVADPAALQSLAIDLVPFPLPATPGGRPTVRLLDGVGDQARTLAVAEILVRAGAQISVLGNADSFGVASTTISHHTEAGDEVADGFREALGFGDVRFEPLSADAEVSFVDVTVVVGPEAEDVGS